MRGYWTDLNRTGPDGTTLCRTRSLGSLARTSSYSSTDSLVNQPSPRAAETNHIIKRRGSAPDNSCVLQREEEGRTHCDYNHNNHNNWSQGTNHLRTTTAASEQDQNHDNLNNHVPDRCKSPLDDRENNPSRPEPHPESRPDQRDLESCNSSTSLLQHHPFSVLKTRDSVQLIKQNNLHKVESPSASSSNTSSPASQRFTTYSPALRRKRTSTSSTSSDNDDKMGDDIAETKRTSRPVKRPVVTEEMLEKHSLHYLLINNFFMSDSDDSLAASTVKKKVRFNTEPIIITERNISEFVYIEAGAVFQTRWETLERHGNTLLGGDEKWDYFDEEKERFIFDVIKWIPYDQKVYPGVPDEPMYVKPECFESVLFYYQDRDNTLRCPKGVKNEVFVDTLKFFKINSREMSLGPYERGTDDHFDDLVPKDPNTIQAKLFLVLYHKTSVKTKIYTFFDVLFILTSVISCIVATLPSNRPPNLDDEATAFFNKFSAIKLFVIIDGVCMVWFFILFILHFIAAPIKMKFFSSFQTVIDIVILIAFCLFVSVAHTDLSDSTPIKHLLRLTFSFRILRLSRHSLLLNSLGIALKEASRELTNVTLFLFVIVVLFGCLEYFMEVKEPPHHELIYTPPPPHVNCTENCTEYHIVTESPHHEEEDTSTEGHLSILEYVWWSLITITTVGYGTPDIHTTAGKIVGGMCAIAGVPLFAIPIPILSKHLERVYQREVRKNECMKDMMAALARGGSEEEDSEEEDGEGTWTKIVGERRKSMGPQFSMTHFRA